MFIIYGIKIGYSMFFPHKKNTSYKNYTIGHIYSQISWNDNYIIDFSVLNWVRKLIATKSVILIRKSDN